MKDDVFALCDLIRETAYAIHVFLGHGHNEKVYVNALTHRLQKQGVSVLREYPSEVFDEDGTQLGTFQADMFIDNRLIVEIKAANENHDEHTAQLLGYLRSSNVQHGMLINFGTYRFFIKKFIFSKDHPKPEIIP